MERCPKIVLSMTVRAGVDKQGNADLSFGATAGEHAYEATAEAGRARFGVSAGGGAGVRSCNDENGYGFGFDYGPVSMDLQLNEVAAKEWADKVDGTFSNGWDYTKSGGESAIGWVGKKLVCGRPVGDEKALTNLVAGRFANFNDHS